MSQPNFALGRNEKLFVVPETTYGTGVVPAAGNAVKFRDCNFAQSIERVQRDDKRSTRSYLETIQRRKSVQWSVGGYLLPSGAAGTGPDGWDDIFEATFGTQTVNASTSVVYTFAKEFDKSLTFHRGVGTSAATAVFGETVVGAVVNELTFQLSGQDEAKVTASGMAAEVYRAGKTLVASDTGTAITVTTGDGPKFDAGAFIDAGSVTLKVVASVVGDVVTIASHSATSAADIVAPSACTLAQTFVSTAKPISGILGSCTFDSAALDVLSATIQIQNGVQMHDNKYGVDKADGFHRGNRSVSGSVQVRLTDTTFMTIAKSRRNTLIPLTLVSGTAAGSIATFTFSNVLIDYTSVPSVQSEDMIITLPFKAYGSSGEDEMTLTLT